MNLKFKVRELINAVFAEQEQRLIRAIQSTREPRPVPRFPCGVVISAYRCVPKPFTEVERKRLSRKKGAGFSSLNPQDYWLESTVWSYSALMSPKQTQTHSFGLETNIKSLRFAAYGPCSLMSIKVANQELAIWQGDGSPVATYDDTVTPGNRISIIIQSWDWR